MTKDEYKSMVINYEVQKNIDDPKVKKLLAIFNKAQDIYREFRFTPAYLTGALSPMDLDYTADGIYKITAKFQCDAYKETRIGAITV